MALLGVQLQFLKKHWGKLAIVFAIAAVLLVMRWKPVAVERHVVSIGTITSEVLGTGTLDARTRATVGAKIAGRIVEILADQGDVVKQGKTLARIDDADLRRQVSAAEASWRAVQSSIVRAKAEQTRAQAVAQQAQRDQQRLEPLRASNIVSTDNYEQVVQRLAVAQADVARTAAAISEAEQQASAAEESLHMYQARLAEATIIAPFDGLVIRRVRDLGDVAVPGAAIMTVVATDTLWISAWVDESAMAAIRVGQAARIVLRSDPTHDHVGAVVRVGREVDRESREFLVDVRITDPPAQWAIGQRAEVFIRTNAKPDVIRLPWHFLRNREGVNGVWSDDHGRVAWRPLSLGVRGQNDVEVVSGLAASDTIIIPLGGPAATLRDGQRITTP